MKSLKNVFQFKQLMILGLFFIFCVSNSAAQSNQSLTQNQIHYHLEFPNQANGHSLTITLQVKIPNSGELSLLVPTQWGGEKELQHHYRLLKVLPENIRVKKTVQEDRWLIQASPHQTVSISYQILGEIRHQTARAYYRPQINYSQIHLIGETTLIRPTFLNSSTEVSFSFSGLKPDWIYLSSLGKIESNKKIIWTIAKSDFKSMLIKGFEKTSHTYTKFGKLQVVIDNELALNTSETALFVNQLFSIQHQVLKTKKPPFYLVSIQSSKKPCCHFAGLNLAQAVTLYVSSTVKKSSGFKQLLGHELLHRWNGRLLQRSYPEEKIFWFTEGFTNYLALIINWKNHLINTDEFLQHLNQSILKYHALQNQDMEISSNTDQFWQRQDLNQWPYIKGELMAMIWDEILAHQNENSKIKNLLEWYHQFYLWSSEVRSPVSTKSIEQFLSDKKENQLRNHLLTHVNQNHEIKKFPDQLYSCLKKTNKLFSHQSIKQMTLHWALPARYISNSDTQTISVPQYQRMTNQKCHL